MHNFSVKLAKTHGKIAQQQFSFVFLYRELGQLWRLFKTNDRTLDERYSELPGKQNGIK